MIVPPKTTNSNFYFCLLYSFSYTIFNSPRSDLSWLRHAYRTLHDSAKTNPTGHALGIHISQIQMPWGLAIPKAKGHSVFVFSQPPRFPRFPRLRLFSVSVASPSPPSHHLRQNPVSAKTPSPPFLRLRNFSATPPSQPFPRLLPLPDDDANNIITKT